MNITVSAADGKTATIGSLTASTSTGVEGGDTISLSGAGTISIGATASSLTFKLWQHGC